MTDSTTLVAVERLTAKFGDTIENGWASEANPTRVGYFVREFTVPRGQMNPGLTWEITDGKGKFWRLKPTGDHKITVTSATSPAAPSLPAEVGSVEALAKALYDLNPCGEQPTDLDGRPIGPGGVIPWSQMDEYDPKAAESVRRQAQAIADLERSDWTALEDDISDAISDSLDMDWTSSDGAKAVVRLLNELRIPPLAPFADRVSPAVAEQTGGEG